MVTPARPPPMSGSHSRAPARLDRRRSVLVVVDVQERLAPHVHGSAGIVARIGTLMRAAERFAIPGVATEHVPDRIGPMIAGLRERLAADAIFVKTRFCAVDHPAFASMLATTGRTQAVVCGMETHVCVMQTALGLAAAGYDVFVVGDAVGSRPGRQDDRRYALERLQRAGCVVAGAETVLFEWAERGDDDAFRAILALVKGLPDERRSRR
ncbi:nicotinamidase/pyrazinamidase [Burkholderiales bacterium]|nr:nicotinamidase/pyrazinamidase [Burkholderiales bacterium]